MDASVGLAGSWQTQRMLTGGTFKGSFPPELAAHDLQEHGPIQSESEQQSAPADECDETAAQNWPEDWSVCRKRLASSVTNVYFDFFIGSLLVLNIILSAHQTNQNSLEEDPDPVVGALVFFFLLVFTIETSFRIFVFRVNFFCSVWNCIDLAVIVVDWILEIISLCTQPLPRASSFRTLRMVRTLRVLRAIRTLSLFRELYVMLHGFFSAIRAICWAAVLLLMMLTVFGIMAVEILNPLMADLTEAGKYDGCERCPRAFETVHAAILTFGQQIVAGDSWGMVTIPLMEGYPLTVPFFAVVFISIDLGLLNLILSVIVDKAQKAQQDDIKFQLLTRQNAFDEAKSQLLQICKDIDEDKTGSISYEELMNGYDTLPAFKDQMRLLDVERDDMRALFQILDEDGSGDVAYGEFVDQVVKMKSQDLNIALMFVRSQIKDIKSSCQEHSKLGKTVKAEIRELKEMYTDSWRLQPQAQVKAPDTSKVEEAGARGRGQRGNPNKLVPELPAAAVEVAVLPPGDIVSLREGCSPVYKSESGTDGKLPDELGLRRLESCAEQGRQESENDVQLARWRCQVSGFKAALQELDAILANLLRTSPCPVQIPTVLECQRDEKRVSMCSEPGSQFQLQGLIGPEPPQGDAFCHTLQRQYLSSLESQCAGVVSRV